MLNRLSATQREYGTSNSYMPFFGLLLALPFLLTACNTVEGVGEDVESGGQNLEEAAHDASH